MKKFLLIFMVVACQTSQISRPIPFVDSNLQPKSISKTDHSPRGSQELFVEKKNLQIKKKPENTSGSLFAVQSPNAYLFSKKIPYMPGDFLTLKVEPVSSKSKSSDKTTEQKQGESNGAVANPKETSNNADALTAELTSSMPNLGPDDSSNGQVLTEIQAEVVDRSPEGDLVVRALRSSTVDGRNKEISFEAVIPSRVASDSNNFSTKDLRSVKFAETGAESIRRNSTAWNDEYSLRFSGFTETGSKNARQLADDKKKLQDVRDRLDGRIKAFASDRSRFAKERSKFLDERTSLDSKLLESERKVKDKDDYIAKLESELSQVKNPPISANPTQEQGGPGPMSSTAAPSPDSTKALDPASAPNLAMPEEKKGDQNVANQ